MLSDSNERLARARRLTDRRARHSAGLFLAEGPQAVREGLAAGRVQQLFGTAQALAEHADLIAAGSVPVDEISSKAAASLSETVHPQGLVAVCTIDAAANDGRAIGSAGADRGLVVVLVDVKDPGNAGAIVRTSDAAGASAVIFAGDSVDPYNGKCVRATAGSVFHLDVQITQQRAAVLGELRAAGTLCLATSGYADTSLDDLIDAGRLAGPSAWIFGNEAHGLPADVIAAADLAVRVPIYGQAESLNLAAAAAVCLYASARARQYGLPA